MVPNVEPFLGETSGSRSRTGKVTTFGIKVKICGITNFEDASAACEYGADAIGFVFAKSCRQVSPQTARSIIKRLPPFITTVGVFVNEDKSKVRRIAKDCGLTCLQFHGDETPGYCDDFKAGHKIIKAIRVRDERSLSALRKYDVGAFLLDSFVEGRPGGSGVKFDWSIAMRAKKCNKALILAGGITVENVRAAIGKVRPYAIDVSSAIERAPGKKNHLLMKALIEKVHNIN